MLMNLLELIKNLTDNEKKILKNFKYKKNIAYLHNDERLMPKRKMFGLVGIQY